MSLCTYCTPSSFLRQFLSFTWRPVTYLGPIIDWLMPYCVTSSPLSSQRPGQWSSHPRQFRPSSWNWYRTCRQTEPQQPQQPGEICSILFWPKSNTIHPQDLSSCYQAFLSFLLCISYFNPLSSNPTYLMPVCIIPRVSLRVQSKFVCQPSGAVKSQWACHHQTTPRCRNCKQYR